MATLSDQDRQLIIESGLFDPEWYSKRYADVAMVGLDPLEHYQRVGITFGRDPGPLFSNDFYCEQLLRQGRDCSSGVPLLDYMRRGWMEGMNPHPFFDVRHYLRENPDLSSTGAEPLAHFLKIGAIEGRNPHPAFDLEFYRETYPDADTIQTNPLVHFVLYGISEGRAPNGFFKLEDYLSFNPDVAASSMCPYVHYALHGFHEGRNSMQGVIPPTAKGSYQEWILRNDVLDETILHSMQAHISSMATTPVISIIMPVYNTKAEWLREAIESVIAQIYPHWELCIADDASTAAHVRPILEEFRQRDSRIKVAYRQKTGHISVASNSALALATGGFVTFLDHDDVLPRHALYHVAAQIQEQPDALLLYSDEDKLSESGRRVDPHFKSDWNPDLLFSQNYICHLCVIQRALVERVGGFRKGVEGSQDHDLLLRCIPYARRHQIVHIPKVLYHWRIHSQSTASTSDSKSYTTDAAIRALRDYFQAHGPEQTHIEQGLVPNTYRVRWPVSDPQPLVSLLIPTRDRRELVETAVSSIISKSTYQNFEILILDNDSTEPDALDYFEQIQRREPRVRVVPYHHPFNYSAMNNYGVSQAKGDILGFINNDIEVISPGWLSEMVSHALRPDIGCVGAKLYYSNKTLQHGGVILGVGGVAGHSHKHFPPDHPGYFSRLLLVQNLSAVTAACLVLRKGVFMEVEGFDETNLTVAFNDVDLCLKVREVGYRNLWTPYAELFHHESLSRGHEDTPEKQARAHAECRYMIEKWGQKLARDPFYNPNLTLNREDFSLR